MHGGDNGSKVDFDLTRELTQKEKITRLISVTLSTNRNFQKIDMVVETMVKAKNGLACNDP